MLTCALLPPPHSIYSDPAPPPPTHPPVPQFNFSSLSLNSNQSKPLPIHWFISRLASSATASLVSGLASLPLTFIYQCRQSLQLCWKSPWIESQDTDLEADEKKRGGNSVRSMAEQTHKQTPKRMFTQTNGPPSPSLSGLMNGHAQRMDGGIIGGIHPFSCHPSPEALVCNCFMHS